MTLIETCRAMLKNPIEVLDRQHENFDTHKHNMDYLCSMNVISKINGKYTYTPHDIKK